MKKILLLIAFLLLRQPCGAADIDETFANSDAMFDAARSVLDECRDESPVKVAQ